MTKAARKMLFDDPGEQAENPKVFEQARHDTRSLTLDNDTNTYKMERVIPMYIVDIEVTTNGVPEIWNTIFQPLFKLYLLLLVVMILF